MAIGMFSCKHCGPRIAGHKKGCPETPKQVSELSNDELNRAIAEALGWEVIKDPVSSCWVIKGNNLIVGDLPGYCNNWNDLMPLVDEYRIVYHRDTCQVHATSYFHQQVKTSSSTTLRRALAECLYLVLLEKQK